MAWAEIYGRHIPENEFKYAVHQRDVVLRSIFSEFSRAILNSEEDKEHTSFVSEPQAM